MLRQARSVGLKTQFMGPEGVGNASLSNIAGDAAEGMLVTMPKRYDQDPTNQGIVDALKADKKDPSGPYVWITYAAVQSLATALERTGSDEPLALVKDLKANGANTVIGPLNWDEKGDLKGIRFWCLPVARRRFIHGSQVIILPSVKTGGFRKVTLCLSSFCISCSRCLTASRWAVPTR